MKKIILFAAAAIFMLSCSSLKVTTDMDKTVDFTSYKTFEYYGWADHSDKILNDLQKQRIEKAFGAEFKKRGVEFVESGGDAIVTLHIVTQDKTQITANTTSTGVYGGYGGYGGYYGYGPGYGWGGGHSTTTVNEYDYTVGTLMVSVYDAKEKKLIWEAVGQDELSESDKNADERVAKKVAYIMKGYPIPPVK